MKLLVGIFANWKNQITASHVADSILQQVQDKQEDLPWQDKLRKTNQAFLVNYNANKTVEEKFKPASVKKPFAMILIIFVSS